MGVCARTILNERDTITDQSMQSLVGPTLSWPIALTSSKDSMKEPKQNNNEAEAKGIMTKPERDSLLQIVRQRARLAKIDTATYAARLRADFEQQLDTC